MFKGKAIYNPSGKAGEYSYWACNFYVGCSNECTYCYLKKGRGAKTLGGNAPVLKKCFKSEGHAFDVFEKELRNNLERIKMDGLFFTFTSDPCLKETIGLTVSAIDLCNALNVPVKILTKSTYFGELDNPENNYDRSKIAIGLTLTGHDELESKASSNIERVNAIKMFNQMGYKTFASIEPIIDLKSSGDMISATETFCDHYKIGLEAGKKFNKLNLRTFITLVNKDVLSANPKDTIYWKDGILKQAGINRESLPPNCVDRDYDIFKLK